MARTELKTLSDKLHKRTEDYKEIRDKILRGERISIPFTTLPKTNLSLPGLIFGDMYMVLAGTNVGKTQFTVSTFVCGMLDWVHDNPGVFDLDILYFALESNSDEFIDTLILHYLQKYHNVYINSHILKGYRADTLDPQLIQLIDLAKVEIDKRYAKHIRMIDDCYEPRTIHHYCSTHLLNIAETETEKTKLTSFDKFGDIVETTVSSLKVKQYHNPKKRVLTIIDHINNFQPVTDKKVLMDEWSTKYCVGSITKDWGWAVVNVVQQDLDSQGKTFSSFRGDLNIEATIPTLKNLGDSKTISRDHHAILALYDPSYYDVPNFQGYQIIGDKNSGALKSNYRGLFILKNRKGEKMRREDLFFDGNSATFEPLPDSSNVAAMDKVYATVKKFRNLNSENPDPTLVNQFISDQTKQIQIALKELTILNNKNNE